MAPTTDPAARARAPARTCDRRELMSLHARSLAISLLRRRRAMLYTGGDPKKILKAVGLRVDSICLDLEDAVAANAKQRARVDVAAALDTIDFGASECIVRINACGTGLERDDLRAVFSARRLPDAVLVPKVESAEHLRWVAAQIDSLCAARPGVHTVATSSSPSSSSSSSSSSFSSSSAPIALIALIENAAAFLNLRDITRADARLAALIFGADDYAADVGATRSATGEEMQWARHWVHLHAAAAGLQCLDMVQTRFKEPALLEAECRVANAIGYTGKQIIHPAQVEITQRAFTPAPDVVARAQRVVDAFKASAANSKGALQLDGEMVDAANVKVAQSTLARAGITVEL